MRKWHVIACLLVLGLLGVLPTTVAAQSHYYGWSRITNDMLGVVFGPDEGMCVDVPRGSKTVGTVVITYRCHDDKNQKFRLLDQAFASRIAVYEGADQRCLNYGPRDGFNVVFIDNCANAPRWQVDLVHINPVGVPDVCLAVSPVFGFLTVSQCLARDAEAFGHNWGVSMLARLGGARTLRSVANLNACVDVRGGSTSPGASVLHYTCHGGANQFIQVHRVDWLKGNMVMLSVYQGGQQLCLANTTNNNLDAVEAVPCNPSQVNLIWESAVDIGNSGIGAQTTFVNAETRRCMTAYTGKSKWVGTQPCNGQNNQKWRL